MDGASPGSPHRRVIESMVDDLLSSMTDEERTKIHELAEGNLFFFRADWGARLRHRIALRIRRPGTLDACRAIVAAGHRCFRGGPAVILRAVWNRLHGFDLDHHQRAEQIRVRCERCGEIFPDWSYLDGEPVWPDRRSCQDCLVHGVPRRQRIEQENAKVKQALETARRLGEVIHERWIAAGEGASDRVLVHAARQACVSDPEFREWWTQARGWPPGARHLPWLWLWKEL